tara:strand:+ start:534 stop:794 length:261 start_codon:yes stop_codon:yes gene_type:complete
MGRLSREQLEIKKRMKGFVFTLFQEAGAWNDSEYQMLRDSRKNYDTDDEHLEGEQDRISSWVKGILADLKKEDINDLKRTYGALIK